MSKVDVTESENKSHTALTAVTLGPRALRSILAIRTICIAFLGDSFLSDFSLILGKYIVANHGKHPQTK